jgi:hypothetical protein
MADGLVWESGLSEYLLLLSMRMTCKYKGVSFLKFLLSRETDIDQFCRCPCRKRLVPEVELQPEGWTNPRRKRKQDWDKMPPKHEA